MVLVDVLGALRGLIKVKARNCDIDSAVFKLHYRVTALFLFSCCLLVTCNGLLGNPINCAHGNSPFLEANVVNTFCWIHSTFTLPRYLHEGQNNNPHPGVGQTFENDEKTYHAYYQWVPFVLLLQGLLFYIPHWLWKTWEGGKIDAIVMGLSSPVLREEDRTRKINRLRDYLHSSLNAHNFYAFKFLMCEVFNCVNVLWQMWFLNKFLGGTFMTYGIDVVNFTEQKQSERTDPMIVVFPRVTKCTFEMFGPSGSIVTHDLMCILALNIINEKIFVFLWFWFVMLTSLSFISFLYRILVFCVPVIRKGLLQKRVQMKFKITLDALTPKLQFGDYFLLYLLSKNVEMLSFSTLLEELTFRISSPAKSFLDHQEIKLIKKFAPSRGGVREENPRLLDEPV